MSPHIAAAIRLHLRAWVVLLVLLAGVGTALASGYPQGIGGPAGAPSLTTVHDRPDAVLPDHGGSIGTRMVAIGPDDTDAPPATLSSATHSPLPATRRTGDHVPPALAGAAAEPGLWARAPPAS
ncbi:hypothetical protein [Pelagibacterium montanilacus]|uniref:hypothetical protein n=1 Tax=Pelagibacterium montanilacus TaxID=2185280 RepID=UPI000F8F52CB|nr:hypothetical protein [Pelagibacterium montanilacus]